MHRPPSSMKWVGHEVHAKGPAPARKMCQKIVDHVDSPYKILTVTSLAVVMALLAPKFRFEKTLRTLGVAFTTGQLPIFGTHHTLVATWSAARVTAQIAFGTSSSVAVVTVEETRNIQWNGKLCSTKSGKEKD
jgi:hypothetical protein